MRRIVDAVSKQKHVIHATITKEGLPAVHLKKIPIYRLLRICENQGLACYSLDSRKHHHLEIRNKTGHLIAVIVNQDLLLLPKSLKDKSEVFELVNTIAEYREGKKTR
ncbi:hypothetical protein HUU53_02900 [Candidatus Micrarchaeota archaeon]|nr:hypothetical protein [Candidatus Micrarchaeota archaeon]